MDSLSPKAHIDMHNLCGEVFDGIKPINLANTFGMTNIAEMGEDFVYTGPGADA